MKTVKVSKLTGAALDWAVAKCEGITPIAVKKRYSEGYILYSLPASTIPLEYSNKWAQGGPIIERHNIATFPNLQGEWAAYAPNSTRTVSRTQTVEEVFVWAFKQTGPTPLIAAMRCYVASKLGDTIELPEELL